MSVIYMLVVQVDCGKDSIDGMVAWVDDENRCKVGALGSKSWKMRWGKENEIGRLAEKVDTGDDDWRKEEGSGIMENLLLPYSEEPL